MACYFPLPAYRTGPGAAPKIGRQATGVEGESLKLPCGRCVGCRLARRRAWSIRCMHEAQLWDSNLFVTLTYSPDKLESWSLVYRHFVLFAKLLNNPRHGCGVSKGPKGNKPVRYFVSGEYGPAGDRPHFHALLFNCRFRDMQAYVNGSFESATATRLWGRGLVHIGTVTPRSAAYVAGYTLEKVYGPGADSHYDLVDFQTGEVISERVPEFCQMSRRPGIGALWYDRFKSDLFGSASAPRDFAVMEGQAYQVPRYYMEKYRAEADGGVVEEIEHARWLRSRAFVEHSTPERLAVREEYARGRLAAFARPPRSA